MADADAANAYDDDAAQCDNNPMADADADTSKVCWSLGVRSVCTP